MASFAVRLSSLFAGGVFLFGSCASPAQGQSPSGPLTDKTGVASSPAPSAPPVSSSSPFSGEATVSLLGYILTIVVLGAAGITILLRGGLGGVSFGSAKTARKLRIEETRAVGSRQQLVVAEYEGRKMLLGISQGRIDYLCGLAGVDEGREAGFSAALSEAAAHCPPQTSSQVKDILGEKVAKDGRPDA